MMTKPNPFTLEVRLKQYTPMLHFQDEQAGAAIRATELKPALDRFILRHQFNNNPESCKEFLVGYSGENNAEDLHPAFDYRLTVEAGNMKEKKYVFHSYISRSDLELFPEQIKPVSGAPFFASAEAIKTNRGDTEITNLKDARKGIWLSSVTLRFQCLDGTLLSIIERNLLSFFALNNFGTRKNKGFGSFFPEGYDSENAIEELIAKDIKGFALKIHSDGISALKEIHTTYNALKGGIDENNGRGPRRESLFSAIKDYYEEVEIDGEPIVWEKDVINDNWYHGNPSKNIAAGEHFRYVRALLGLADHFTYTQRQIAVNKVNIKDHSEQIQRFPSPIFFKVFKDKILIIIPPNSIPDLLYDRKFVFTSDRGGEVILKTPPASDKLDLRRFLSTFLPEDWQPF